MSRNINGNYTLPGTNPVVANTTITDTWANGTMTDVGTEMTDSLSRSGKGGMLAQLKNINGSVIAPAVSFLNDTSSGAYLSSTGEVRYATGGVDRMRWKSTGVEIWDVLDSTWYRVLSTKELSEWVVYGAAPTFVSATEFTLVGDQTARFQVGRRVKTDNTLGDIYSTITTSVFGAATLVTVVNDSGVLDAGLSAVSTGLLSSINPSIPKIALPNGSTAITQAPGDNSTDVATTAYADTAIAVLDTPGLTTIVAPTAIAASAAVELNVGLLDTAKDVKNSYLLRLWGFVPDTNDVELQMLIGYGAGPTYNLSNVQGAATGFTSGGDIVNFVSNGGQHVTVAGGTGLGQSQGNGASDLGYIDIELNNFNTGTSIPAISRFSGNFRVSSGALQTYSGGAQAIHGFTHDYDAVKLTFEAGNFTAAGHYALYKRAIA